MNSENKDKSEIEEYFSEDNRNPSPSNTHPAITEFQNTQTKTFFNDKQNSDVSNPSLIKYDENGIELSKFYSSDGVAMSEKEWAEKTGNNLSALGNTKQKIEMYENGVRKKETEVKYNSETGDAFVVTRRWDKQGNFVGLEGTYYSNKSHRDELDEKTTFQQKLTEREKLRSHSANVSDKLIGKKPKLH